MLYNVADLFNFLPTLSNDNDQTKSSIERLNAISDELGRLGKECEAICTQIDSLVDSLDEQEAK